MDESGTRRIVVGVSGSLGSLAALHRAVDQARRTGAEVLAVLAWDHGLRHAPAGRTPRHLP
jgi:tRNA(Ile)-lysidine synthase TilS/MesJ